ncbi:10264_t:CDS:2, partial [Scutellospora calospora]
IKKAGDIIPQVIQEEIYQNCPNEDCSERNIKSLTLFSSKPGMDIKGISEMVIRKLYQTNLLKTPADFYYLEPRKKELLKIEGLQRKSVNNLLNSVERSKKMPFFCLITALGIPLLGKVKARKLADFYSDLISFIQAIEENKLDLIGQKLGAETQKEVMNYFQKPKNLSILKELVKVNN